MSHLSRAAAPRMDKWEILNPYRRLHITQKNKDTKARNMPSYALDSAIVPRTINS